MKFTKKYLALLTMAGITTHVLALDKNGQYAIKGVGNASCQQFVKVTRNDEPQKFLFAGWLNGYMTAHNQHLKDSFDIASWENVETLGNYLIGHCEKNPQLSFFQASTQMLSELYPKRIIEYVGAENASTGQQSQKIYIQVVQRVQHKLTELKYYSGAIDGKLNEQLKQAVAKFRIDKELPSQTFFDQQFLHALLMAN
ncbi:HdeA/HdeB family chaperone [Paraglaciecola aquimarina]|uniref:HdeA/HdeB family chaperone n=1 Tax=Paraglaciecola aquimarina TaxID=1235557 RepID=A0ABU3SV63_9ALTE|nr:HdeA/HdeB family chaperone [Paraglaciecola aquimarina]MDU0353883.1 HdeA/HdeB family chaperone [Paraglaciecola aquimarina]